MPLVTARQLAEARPEVEVPPAAEPERARPAPEGPAVRMHHPDDPTHRMHTEFTLDGEAVKVEMGVAVVRPEVARRLEAMGWLRGSEVKV